MKYVAVPFLVLLCSMATAQKKGQSLIDSLVTELPAVKDDTNKVNLLMRVALTYLLVEPKKGFGYAGEGMQLAQKINWKPGIANGHNTLGLLLGDTGNNTLARTHFEQSLALNKELDAKFRMISNLNNIGRSYQRESDVSHAAENYFKALAIAEDIKSNEQIALVCTNITASFYAQKNYTKATEYAEMALKNGELAKVPDHIGKALMQLGVLKGEVKDTIAAKSYYTRALQVYEDMNNRPAIAQVLSNMAQLEYPDYKKAIAEMMNAQEIYDQTAPASIGSIDNLANLGQTYFDWAVHSTADRQAAYLQKSGEYLQHAMALAKQTDNPEYSASVALMLANLEEKKGNYKTALSYYKTYYTTNDSLFSQDKKNEIAGLESKQEIDLKNKEIAINKLSLQNQQRMLIGSIAGRLLLAIIGGLLYRQSRNRKKTNTTLVGLNTQLDEANKVKARLFGILSHDRRGPIANLINFLHLQKNDPDLLPPAQQAIQQQKISQSAEDLLSTMETMLLWSKEQMENFKPQIKPVAVNNLFADLQRLFSQIGDIHLQFSDAAGLLLETDENYLRTIMQNLTANAINAVKNTPTARIDWIAKHEGNKTILSITDNGPGIGEEQVSRLFDPDSATINSKNGLGLHLIRDLANAIQCRISVQSIPGTGTTFTLSPIA